MATSSLGITLIANGTQSGSWGDTTNTNWQYMEDAVAGVYGLNLSGGTTYTFGTALLARYAVINVANAGGNATISFPAVSKVYIISNNSGYSVTLQVTGGGGSSVVVANTLTTLVYCDGTNFNSGITGFTGGNLAITGSITASGSITGASFTSPSGVPQFGGGATGQIPYQTATNTTAYTPTPTTGTYLQWNGSSYTWASAVAASSANDILGHTGSGGSTWSIPYQTSPGNTGFLTPSGATPLTLQWNGSAVLWAAGGAVSSFSAGTTGFTPSSPTGSAVVLGGVLNTTNGGTQVSSSGASGNLLVSNGSVWTTQTPASANLLTTSTGAQLTANNNFSGNNTFTAAGAGYQRFNAVSGGIGVVADASAGGTTIGYASIVNASASYQMIFGYGTVSSYSVVGSITSTGSSTAYNTSSDRRLKENIAPLTNSGAVIDAMQPRTFTWISTKETAAGFIADELQQVMPSAVHGQPNAVDETGKPVYQGIDASTPEMMALLVAEIQALRKRVAALESKVGA